MATRRVSKVNTAEEAICDAALASSSVGLQTLDIEGDITSIAARVTQQAQTLQHIDQDTADLARQQTAITEVATQAVEQAFQAKGAIINSTHRIRSSTDEVLQLLNHVSTIQTKLAASTTRWNQLASLPAVSGRLPARPICWP
jgi:methyl-accepting chemotaxis protein